MKFEGLNTAISRVRNYFTSLTPTNYIPVRKKNKSYDFNIGSLDFAEIVFENICDLLVDLVADTTLKYRAGNVATFDSFSNFFERDGKRTIIDIFKNGYAVIGYLNQKFFILDCDDYIKVTDGKKLEFKHRDPNWEGLIVSFEGEHNRTYGMSHYEKLKPFMELLNNVLNASNTITKKLGVTVFAGPRTVSGMNTISKLQPKVKEALEKETEKSYGALDTQKIIHFLSEDLRFEVINLAGQNLGLDEKMKIAVLAIADKIKVPANQVSLIDAQGSKSFANGSEMIAGDFAKYQAFERLLVSTFIELAKMLQLEITYEIYNKPVVTPIQTQQY